MGRSNTLQKRSHKRIPSSLVVKFFHNDSIHYGIIMNISERGMFINTGMRLPADSVVKLLILLKDRHLDVPVKVRWCEEIKGHYDHMGVEVVAPSRDYLLMVESMKNSGLPG